jgi:hypothetical protein
MSGKSRSKGARGEREILQIIQDRFPDFDLQRNYDQAAFGGCDVLGLPGVSLEVKRYARGNVYRREWWEQACAAVSPKSIPVLAYRFDRTDWQSVVPLQWMAMESITEPLDMIAIMPFNKFLDEYEMRYQLNGCAETD